MTTCTWIDRDEVFESYVRKALGPEDQDAFEAHYFECAECFDKVETYRALRAELSATPAVAPETQVARVRVWRWAFASAATGLILVAVLAVWLRVRVPAVSETTVVARPAPQSPSVVPSRPTQPAPAGAESAGQPQPAARPVVALSVLARVEPPVYVPMTLRGPRDEAARRFDDAMRRYMEGDYEGAIPELTAAAGLNPNAPRIAFFLAICDLLTGRLDAAIDGLQKTIALGDSPYLEEAHFYLAKARLRQGDIRAARSELLQTIERRGRLEAEARRLVAQLDTHLAGKDRPPAK